MKALAFSILASLCLGLNAQTVRVPLFVELPIPPPQTNWMVVTNWMIATNVVPPIVPLQNDLVDARIGTRLIRYMSGPANFTFAGLTNSAQITLYWLNPTSAQMKWPSNAFWFGPPITNQIRGAVLVENVFSELWLSPQPIY